MNIYGEDVLKKKCVITCALTGVAANRHQCPALPYTLDEYAEEGRRAYEAGATVLHIHARDDDGSPTMASARYGAIREAVLKKSPIAINFSTGAIGIPMAERVGHVIDHKPAIGALNMGSMNYAKYSDKRKNFIFDMVFANPFVDIVACLEAINKAGSVPELECFDAGHIGNVYPLLDMGILKPPFHFSLIMGVLGGIPPTAQNLANQISLLPPGANWEVIGISHIQWLMVGAAISLGGNIRVGLEDNFYRPNGEMAKSNGELVEDAAKMVRMMGREVATIEETRKILGLRHP